MALGYGESGDALGASLRRVNEIWATVGHGSIDDQPVKLPSDDEVAALTEALEDAQAALKAFVTARKKV